MCKGSVGVYEYFVSCEHKERLCGFLIRFASFLMSAYIFDEK